MRVVRYFAFVDLSGFTLFTDEYGDDESVRVLSTFRSVARDVATDFGIRIAKWLGDGCMFVSVDPDLLVHAVVELVHRLDELDVPLEVHAGVAGGDVILLEGDDYTGRAVNLASRLCDRAGPHEVLTTDELAAHVPPGCVGRTLGALEVPGLRDAVQVVCIDGRPHEPAPGVAATGQ